MRIKASFWAMLRPQKSPAPAEPLEEIRQAMLAALERHSGTGQLNLEAEIGFATDLAALWYVRPKLLQALSVKASQRTAERELRSITALFVGHFTGG
jgi:hypothetical protein